jgi:hypothetical protein
LQKQKILFLDNVPAVFNVTLDPELDPDPEQDPDPLVRGTDLDPHQNVTDPTLSFRALLFEADYRQ